MSAVSHIVRRVRPYLDRHPAVKSVVKSARNRAARLEHSIAASIPEVIRPRPRQLTIAITAHCNLRCKGCRYGRDFMPGQQLSFETVQRALDDAKLAGIDTVRLYGGEPLLHPDLPKIIAYSTSLGFRTYVTSNGTLLKNKIDELYYAGLRLITIGFYGVQSEYDSYTQRKNLFKRLEQSLTVVRDRYGSELELQLNFLIMPSSCNAEAWNAAWTFAKRFDMYFHLDLLSYSTPFFTSQSDNDAGFGQESEPVLREMVNDFLRFKDQDPSRFLHAREFIRSVPDWLLLRSAMRVPCDAYEHLWIGADGTVQLCDTAFKLGNLNEIPLKEILFSNVHRCAARDAFQLKCPNCMCQIDSRILKDAQSMKRYG